MKGIGLVTQAFVLGRRALEELHAIRVLLEQLVEAQRAGGQ